MPVHMKSGYLDHNFLKRILRNPAAAELYNIFSKFSEQNGVSLSLDLMTPKKKREKNVLCCLDPVSPYNQLTFLGWERGAYCSFLVKNLKSSPPEMPVK
jgi:hypothetical protein